MTKALTFPMNNFGLLKRPPIFSFLPTDGKQVLLLLMVLGQVGRCSFLPSHGLKPHLCVPIVPESVPLNDSE